MTRLWMLCALCFGVGCAIPRGGMQMMGADRIGKGGAEVGMAAGFAYTGGSQNAGGGTSVGVGQLQVPLLEANARIGLTDMVDVNVHAGANGIAPGVKVGFNLGAVEVAAMPSVALGLYRVNTSSPVGGGGAQTMLNFEAGLRAIASLTELGGFFGIAYWFQYFNTGTEPATGTGGSTQTGHNIGFNLGWQFDVGAIRLRPEIAFVIQAGATSSNGTTSTGLNPMFTVMPAITIAGGGGGTAPKK